MKVKAKNKTNLVGENTNSFFTKTTPLRKPFFVAATPSIQKEEDEESTNSTSSEERESVPNPSGEAESTEINWIGDSPFWPATEFWNRGILGTGRRWRNFRGSDTFGAGLFDPALGGEANYKQLTALYNLLYAWSFSQSSDYPDLDFSKALKIAELLSGVDNTYLHLGSLGLRFDLEKYLSDDLPDLATNNMLASLLWGLSLQAGMAGINRATDSEIDFTSLINPIYSALSPAPHGVGRSHLLGNIPDPRWGSYPFHLAPTGLEFKHDHYYDESPNSFTAQFGLNIPALFDRDHYTEEGVDRAQYRGWELYPYGFYNNQRQADGDTEPTDAHRWLGGVFGGTGGFYGQFEGGQRYGPTGRSNEDYLRAAFLMRNFGPLRALQADTEWSQRPAFGGWRPRLNVAADIDLYSSNRWRFSAGARVGGLLPNTGRPGAFEGGGGLSLYHLTPVGEGNPPLQTGASLEFMNRLQDPFDTNSARLNSVLGRLTIFNIINFSAEYHQANGGTPGSGLPENDFRMMMTLGRGVFYPQHLPGNQGR